MLNSKLADYKVYILGHSLVLVSTFFLQNGFELSMFYLYICIVLQALGAGIQQNTGVMIFSLRNDPQYIAVSLELSFSIAMLITI